MPQADLNRNEAAAVEGFSDRTEEVKDGAQRVKNGRTEKTIIKIKNKKAHPVLLPVSQLKSFFNESQLQEQIRRIQTGRMS